MKKLVLFCLAASLLFGCKKDKMIISFDISNPNPTSADAVTFTNTSQNGESCLWEFSDGKTYASDVVVRKFPTGSYTVKLTIFTKTRFEGKSISLTKEIVVIAGPGKIGFLKADIYGSYHDIFLKITSPSYRDSVTVPYYKGPNRSGEGCELAGSILLNNIPPGTYAYYIRYTQTPGSGFFYESSGTLIIDSNKICF